jgi:hypothetical protein
MNLARQAAVRWRAADLSAVMTPADRAVVAVAVRTTKARKEFAPVDDLQSDVLRIPRELQSRKQTQ